MFSKNFWFLVFFLSCRQNRQRRPSASCCFLTFSQFHFTHLRFWTAFDADQYRWLLKHTCRNTAFTCCISSSCLWYLQIKTSIWSSTSLFCDVSCFIQENSSSRVRLCPVLVPVHTCVAFVNLPQCIYISRALVFLLQSGLYSPSFILVCASFHCMDLIVGPQLFSTNLTFCCSTWLTLCRQMGPHLSALLAPFR